jgi:uncharacterized protein YkwD
VLIWSGPAGASGRLFGDWTGGRSGWDWSGRDGPHETGWHRPYGTTAPAGSAPASAPTSAPTSAPPAPAAPGTASPPGTSPPGTPAPGQGDQPTAAATTAPQTGGGSGSVEAALIGLMNDQRRAAGCGAVQIDPRLTSVAAEHNRYMASTGNFDHGSADGKSLGERFTAAGFSWRWIGENITAGSTDAAGAIESWRNSPGHKAIMEQCDATHAGAAYEPAGNYWTLDVGTAA